jgi:hypothetical protein
MTFKPETIEKVELFVTSSGNWFMTEIAQIFQEGFLSQGLPTEIIADQLPDLDTKKVLQIIVAPHEYYPLFLEQEVDSETCIKITKNVYFLTVEQPGSSWFEIPCQYGKHVKGIFDINVLGVEEFKFRKIPVIHTPLGYSSAMQAVADDNGQPAQKSTDILFFGSHSPKRELFISRNASFFNQYRCKLIFVRLDKPRLKTTAGFYTDEARNTLLKSSKILINIHSSDRTYFEWHRALLAIANHCLFVSELSDHIDPLVDGKHLVLSPFEDLASTCEYYLQNEHLRVAIAENAYNFVTQHLNSSQVCQSLLNSLGETPIASTSFKLPTAAVESYEPA